MNGLARMLAACLLALSVAPGLRAAPLGTAYPSGPSVPENLLRIELRFSTPLNQQLDIRNVKLFDADGAEIPGAFLDLPLSAEDGRMVTILMHPGRVKSGVGANLALGRALHQGATVTLVIDAPAIARPVRKTWKVTSFDARAPQPSHWKFALPRAGTRDPIVLHLDKPISLSSESLIAIRSPEGDRLDGDSKLEHGETQWRFVPAKPWGRATYAVVTHPDLEGPEGNRPCGPFEAVRASLVQCEQGTAEEFLPQ
jgi:hypothetical protein